jgi:hypothetical protein
MWMLPSSVELQSLAFDGGIQYTLIVHKDAIDQGI